MATGTWPNFFIVGAPRAGTTSLWQYLRKVPGVYMSPFKEPHYFAASVGVRYGLWRGPRAMTFPDDEAKYLKFFQGAKNEAAIGEASASYLSDPEAARRIHEAVPNARIIMILRDPVERAYSNYLWQLKGSWQRATFREAIQAPCYFEPGLYSEQVKRYLDTFGKGRLKILISEEFIKDTKAAVRDVLNFLDVHSEPPTSIGKTFNVFAAPRGPLARIYLSSGLLKRLSYYLPPVMRRTVRDRIFLKQAAKPPMPPEVHRIVEELYRDDVLKLEKILGRSLPWSPVRS